MLGGAGVRVVKLEARLEQKALARQRGVVGVVKDVAQGGESLPSTDIGEEAGNADAAIEREMIRLIAKAKFREAVRGDSKVEPPAGRVFAVGGDAGVVEINVKGLRCGESTRRDKKVTEPVERMVVLGGGAVAGAGDEVV